MLTYFEERRRAGWPVSSLYKVRTWYLFGCIRLLRRWEQLTVSGDKALPSEVE